MICCTGFVHAQTSAADIVRQHRSKKPVFINAGNATESAIIIPCAFGKAELAFPPGMPAPGSVQITAIDLAFTDYPSGDDLIALNTKRIQHLFDKFPQLAADKNIEWNVVRQMNGATRDSAIGMFHGFVISYRPLQNKATLKKDIEKLKTLLTPETTLVKKRHGFVAADTTLTKLRYETEEYTTILKLPAGKALEMVGIDPNERTAYKTHDSLFVYLKPATDSSLKTIYKEPEDSTVIKVLDRMQWNNMMVAADVTASMYPYTGQLLLWLKLHEDERRIRQFVFFNDGDDKEEDAKITGSTGGIYITSSSVFEVVEDLLYKTMNNGNGGATPENNIEALLKGSCSNCDHIVMIADNGSRVSDLSLLPQLQKPVHIILCGVHGNINPDYLEIACKTGGSVHTAEEDLQLAMQLKEGALIKLHGKNYILSGGKFRLQ
ncbi:MAG: hypothetical protein U0V75_05090 [Ferruginibacter sp.]